ncbi:Phosphoglycerol transferase MdoB [Pseudobutyrivibrio sp. UC1225]|uniref:LTA synthase family protein n=1 Tax=Pseudobutyrivibrio sp. UC1225 TaxID=1798185 RepID=UPI0008EAC27F|nr:sulfatase-like hydrolase/transferase [Pseudobutyrivibrio sp. UC1225]SFO27329.1 Phosphoglycerol transferase MdoB [Pseudobutyrivibrio sp. UC1225]
MISRLKDKAFRRGLFTIIKFILAVVLTVMTYFTTRHLAYVTVGLAELALIFIIYNLIVEKKWGRILACILFFIYVGQMTVLYFGNSYVTLTMLKNVKFLQDLGGRAVAYILGTVLALAIIFLPGKAVIKLNKRIILYFVVALLIVEVAVNIEYKRFSPVQSFATIFVDQLRYQHVKRAAADPQVALATFHKDSVEDGINKPESLPEKPNIIVIFTEGLSSNIISDEREIMPSVREFEKSCISFKNYYNHTFPTLRGVQGQLYSGYKLDDDKKANNLISLQSVLKDQGYRTAFVNTEPFNEEFTQYLNNLGFDEIVEDKDNVTGLADGMTDGEAYRLLTQTVHEMEESDEPFLLGIYTFGTHVSFNSKEYQYGDGANGFLNKFYNCDQMFNYFLEEFKSSKLADNTILVFTTDHSTYADQSYTDLFPDHKRECTDLDEMPLFIYHKDIQPQEIDVEGRNSLCFTPTILDLLDINTENYFLGTSLFDKNASSSFDKMFYDASYLISTEDAQIRYLEELEKEEFLSQVLAYFSALEAER